MKHALSAIAQSWRPFFRLVALMALLSAPLAHADVYGDVNQLVRSGKLAQALVQADQHLATKPRDPQMRFLKGVIQTASGKTDEAISTLLALTLDYPELPEPHNNLAALYAGQGQLDKALAALEMAVRLNPGYAIAHENLGDVHVRLARQAYARALQLDSTSTSAQAKTVQIQDLLSPAKSPRP
jgi:tetratricopeptide (TPR) repeat protein